MFPFALPTAPVMDRASVLSFAESFARVIARAENAGLDDLASEIGRRATVALAGARFEVRAAVAAAGFDVNEAAPRPLTASEIEARDLASVLVEDEDPNAA